MEYSKVLITLLIACSLHHFAAAVCSTACDVNAYCDASSDTCVCYDGWVLNGSVCVDRNECDLSTGNSCGQNATCSDGTTNYTFDCTCNFGYTLNPGVYSGTPYQFSATYNSAPGGNKITGCGLRTDECNVGTGNACISATCVDNPEDLSFNCSCNAGTALDTSPAVDPSNYVYVAQVTSVPGGTQVSCYDIDTCRAYGCPAAHNDTCTKPVTNGRTCTCQPGYNPDQTNWGVINKKTVLVGNDPFLGCIDVDECATYGCGLNATCSTPDVNMRQCTCDQGFGRSDFGFPPHYETTVNFTGGTVPVNNCVDIDECAAYGCDGGPCVNGALNERNCSCPTGKLPLGVFTVVGSEPFNCTEIDNCMPDSCDALSYCIDHTNFRTCKCNDGYELSTLPGNYSQDLLDNETFDGCTDIADDCAAYGNCQGDPLAVCNSSGLGPNLRHCSCNDPAFVGGLDLHGNQSFPGCFAVNQCTNGTDRCADPSGLAICNATGPGLFDCICPSGYAGTSTNNYGASSNFTNCTDMSDDCSAYGGCQGDLHATCYNTDVDGNALAPDLRRCSCDVGYTGSSTLNGSTTFSGCVDINECAIYNCSLDPNAICTTNATGNLRHCECAAGFSGSVDLVGNASFAGCKPAPSPSLTPTAVAPAPVLAPSNTASTPASSSVPSTVAPVTSQSTTAPVPASPSVSSTSVGPAPETLSPSNTVSSDVPTGPTSASVTSSTTSSSASPASASPASASPASASTAVPAPGSVSPSTVGPVPVPTSGNPTSSTPVKIVPSPRNASTPSKRPIISSAASNVMSLLVVVAASILIAF